MDLNQILRFAVEQHSFFQRGLSKLHYGHPGSPHRTADNLHPKSTAASISLGGTRHVNHVRFPEFGIVQDADRLDAIRSIGFMSRVLHDPAIQPRSDVSKEKYMKKDEQTTVNHFHEELLKLKDLMITKAGQKRAERRHKFMEEFLKESA